MGKLVEKLHQVTQGSSNGFGFFARARTSERAARPAAVLVQGGKSDVPALQAAIDSGADGVIVSSWSVGMAGLSGLTEAVQGREGIWGVALDDQYAAGTLKAAQQQGAAFAVLGEGLPTSALFEEVERFDLVVTVDLPREPIDALLGLRAVNLLPAQAVLIQAGFTPSALAHMSIADFTQLRLHRESLRFPTLLTLEGAPEAASVRTLVQLGADGLVLSAVGATPTAVGQQVKALLAALEATPARRQSEDTVLLSGLLGVPGRPPATPEPEPQRRREPEREPEEP
jgi:hypothetical protein